jgi:hypothetical protein
MNSKLDGVAVAHSDQLSLPRHRMQQIESEHVLAPQSISWTHTAHEQSAALRRDRIAVAAYYMSEARGFEPGHDAEDWLRAQLQVDVSDAGTF